MNYAVSSAVQAQTVETCYETSAHHGFTLVTKFLLAVIQAQIHRKTLQSSTYIFFEEHLYLAGGFMDCVRSWPQDTSPDDHVTGKQTGLCAKLLFSHTTRDFFNRSQS